MAKDARQRRENKGGNYALMGALGTAMTAGSAWYDKEQVEKAKQLREAEMLKLKQGELDLGYKRMEASNKLGEERNRIAAENAATSAANAETSRQQIEDIQSRHESTQKQASVGTFLTTDFEKWKTNFVGDDDDAKLRAKAWGSVLENGLESYTDEDLEVIATRISEQFGTGSSGKELLSFSEIKDGIEQLRTRAKMRGLTTEDVTDGDIRSLLASSFTMGAEPLPDDEAPPPGVTTPGAEGPGNAFPYQGASEALFGEGQGDYLYEGRQSMYEPYFRAGEGIMDLYQENIGQPTQRGVNWLGRKAFGIEDR